MPLAFAAPRRGPAAGVNSPAMDPLSPSARRDLRAKAHHLEPVVTVGQHGLTPQVLHEIDLALIAHELVKVKVLGDDRDVRESMLAEVTKALDCAPVQHVGKILVLWRPNPEKRAKAAKKEAAARPKPAKKAGKPAPVDAVRARRRATGKAWGEAEGQATGKGRRGAARHAGTVRHEATTAPAPKTRRRRTDG